MDSIRLSKKYGLNPSLQKCFFCGAHKSILIPGYIKGDEKMPMECITDLEPCDNCPDPIQHPEKHNAIILIEAHSQTEFTGRYVVITDEALTKEQIEKDGRVYLIEELPENFIKEMENKENLITD